MRRTLAGIVATLALSAPAWANHSTPTGINCGNFQYQEDAQDYFNAHPGDPEGLDGPAGPAFTGIQNVACENQPRRPVATTTPTTTTTTPTTSGVLTIIGTVTTVPTLQIISESPPAVAVRGQVTLAG